MWIRRIKISIVEETQAQSMESAPVFIGFFCAVLNSFIVRDVKEKEDFSEEEFAPTESTMAILFTVDFISFQFPEEVLILWRSYIALRLPSKSRPSTR